MKEYGGYLPIDSRREEYFMDSEHIVKLNAARYAIIEAYKMGKYKKLWIPIYMCSSVIDAVQSSGNIEYSFYNIGNDFEPELERIGDNDCILVPNYYGNKMKTFIIT